MSRFKNVLHNKWLESIVRAVERMVVDQFDILDIPPPVPSIHGNNPKTQMMQAIKKTIKGKLIKLPGQIKPYLMRFFTFINIYMERIIFDKMNESMKKYLSLILMFMARQESIVSHKEFTKLKLDQIVYSIETSPMANIKVQIVKKAPKPKEPE